MKNGTVNGHSQIPPTTLSEPQDHTVTFLMCPPNFYEVKYVINPWMAGNVHSASQKLAAEQWHDLFEVTKRVSNVRLVEPQAGFPDMVFTANAGLERKGIVVLSSFFHSERTGEEAHFLSWFRQAGFSVQETPAQTSFEGEGDALFSTDGSRLWAGHGLRTLVSSHEALRRAWNVDVIPLHLIDPRFYHLDTCFAPLDGGYVMYYPDAFDDASRKAIEAYYSPASRVIVTEEDAVRFACNAINVGRTIILNRVSKTLLDRLRSLGFDVIELDLGEFLKAGGAAKCLVMRLGTRRIEETQRISPVS